MILNALHHNNASQQRNYASHRNYRMIIMLRKIKNAINLLIYHLILPLIRELSYYEFCVKCSHSSTRVLR